jgi:hypothetical protein
MARPPNSWSLIGRQRLGLAVEGVGAALELDLVAVEELAQEGAGVELRIATVRREQGASLLSQVPF